MIVKIWLKRATHLLPTLLPRGVHAFDHWFHDICDTWGLPCDDSYKNAIATMIMHLGPTIDRKPKYFFVKCVRKSSANQIAYAIIEKLREEQKANESKGA